MATRIWRRCESSGVPARRAGFGSLAAPLLLAILCGCASNPEVETPYNLGVQAFKTQQYSKAAKQWSLAADSGDPTAMNNLGYLLFTGQGVRVDKARALSLWQAAAKAGVSESQWHLGAALAAGDGIAQDRSEAYAWYRCAIQTAAARATKNGDDDEREIASSARQSLVELTDTFSGGELDRGQRLATEYIEKYALPAPRAGSQGDRR